ncbi:NAD(P)(+) transhydrogenase (Re/Si-specific) subunit beta [Candidatus Woesearchaeota archaeon]|nr:NAD(P)(+) transhydrogenase (Re/Si-specific) subunit beta [Candidatus Woesearchaeota archaeon]
MIGIDFTYLVAAVLFILGIKGLTKVKTSKRGNMLAAIAMLIAVVITLVDMQLKGTGIGWGYIISGIVIGGLIGAITARKVEMTAMPQMVAIFNGFGGGASVLVATAYFIPTAINNMFDISTVMLSMLIGSVTFTGSVIAFLKLQGWISSRPIIFKGNNIWNGLLFLIIIGVAVRVIMLGQNTPYGISLSFLLIGLAALLGILLVIPIGGADMPVVIALLNSYSGLAAAATGFVLKNTVLIISGALVGASGIILTTIMCKAMNRSLVNVIFGGFGQEVSKSERGGYKNVKESSPEEAALFLESASSVIIIPGYGLAVAQAQHACQELAEMLEKRSINVRFAIHPVAGRMPGHMNVLLAEANVPHEKLMDLDSINADFKNTDVVIVVGANDVVNPAATNDKNSPIYGMPILKAHEARSVFVIKRSLSPGFAGIDNELFDYDNTRMIFADAKQALQQLVLEVEEL